MMFLKKMACLLYYMCVTKRNCFGLQLIEKQRLIEFADALRSKLNYFDELENVRLRCRP